MGSIPALAAEDGGEGEAAGAPLSSRHREWLEAIEPLIADFEREAFLSLAHDYRRQAFIEEFWRGRDPYPETARNELRERWEIQAAQARQRFGGGGDERIGFFAAFGEPSRIVPGRCPELLERLEIWFYESGRVAADPVHLVFIGRSHPDGRTHRLWSPSEGLLSISVGAGMVSTEQLVPAVAERCFRGEEVAGALLSALDWRRLREGGEAFAGPGEEWVATFVDRTTALPAGAGTFEGRLALSFPGRHQSRTVLQGVIAVPPDQVEITSLGDNRSWNFTVDGEVLRKGRLFESFRYRFHLPVGDHPGGEIPLLFQRHLRPGLYELSVRAQDRASGRYFHDRREIEVPAVRPAPAVAEAGPAEAGPAADASSTLLAALGGPFEGGGDGPAAGGGRGGPISAANGGDPAVEANAALAAGDTSLRLLPPPPGLQTGILRLEAVVTGDGVERVSFAVDGKPVMIKGRPPYSVEVDLGESLRTHRVSAVALGAGDELLARDEVVVNAGPHRFAVRLVEPQRGRRYASSLRAQAEVEVPAGERLDRVELFLNDTRLVTLYQPPFAHPVLLPEGLGTAYVRAVAYLADGAAAEDLVFVNAPENLDRIDVRLVELFTSALDRKGRPVDDLGRNDFVIREEGEVQQVRRFERVRDLPIWAGLLLDRSNSMAEEIDEVVSGALTFFEQVLTPKDRATVFTFNDQSELVVRFTNDSEMLAGGVAGIYTEGGTAVWDSLVEALYYFSGINGKRTLLLISDGGDQGSRYSFEEALEYAQRTGVAIYTIGLGLPGQGARERMQLQRLAGQTGGRSFFISRANDLKKVYDSIEEELRSQYLLAYQSSYGEAGGRFREVEVEVERPGVTASTIRGYFP